MSKYCSDHLLYKSEYHQHSVEMNPMSEYNLANNRNWRTMNTLVVLALDVWCSSLEQKVISSGWNKMVDQGLSINKQMFLKVTTQFLALKYYTRVPDTYSNWWMCRAEPMTSIPAFSDSLEDVMWHPVFQKCTYMDMIAVEINSMTAYEWIQKVKLYWGSNKAILVVWLRVLMQFSMISRFCSCGM